MTPEAITPSEKYRVDAGIAFSCAAFYLKNDYLSASQNKDDQN